MRVRPADLGDLTAIAAIEDCELSPWSAAQIEKELLHKRSIALIVTGKASTDVIGWCSARVAVPECELLKIGVLPHRRRQGAGGLLLAALVVRCRRRGCTDIYLEVRESNRQARTFYATAGFRENGRRKAYYSNPADDAILMKMGLDPETHRSNGGKQT